MQEKYRESSKLNGNDHISVGTSGENKQESAWTKLYD